MSPDGRRFVYNTGKGLYLRTMGELEARLIPGTEEDLTIRSSRQTGNLWRIGPSRGIS